MRLVIDNTEGRPDELVRGRDGIDEQQLRSLISASIAKELALVPLKGFKMNLSANKGFQKIFFSANCECNTAALLSVEVSEKKTLKEVQEALPVLVGRLEAKARSFYNMSCDDHTRMRLGSISGRREN
jgi:hypothetical protein